MADSINVSALERGRPVTVDDLAKNVVPAQPRMRVEKNVTPLTLSTSWQRVFFSDPNPLNGNTFTTEANGKQTVSWDSSTGLFMFSNPEDRNYTYEFYGKFQCSNVIGVLTNQPIQVQYRFVVPNGVSSGVPITFPFPGQDAQDGYGVFAMVNFNTETRISNSATVYANQAIRSNGVAFELRLSAAPLGTIKASLSTALIYGRG